jgi:hypothetical protein
MPPEPEGTYQRSAEGLIRQRAQGSDCCLRDVSRMAETDHEIPIWIPDFPFHSLSKQ